ncbi:MAG: glycosyltransferase family 4 protein [Anaerolineae bacterium]|nr:glycosyltransferase family 4 protein [Anaerolineae bacterium]
MSTITDQIPPKAKHEGNTVLFVQLGGGVSGSGESLRLLVEHLVASGYHCAALIGSEGPLCEALRDLGVDCRAGVIAAAGHNEPNPLRLADVIRFFVSLPRSLRHFIAYARTIRPDLVYLNTSVLLGPAIAARLMGLPVVWHVREPPGHRGLLPFLTKSAIRLLASQIIANSNYVAGCFGPLPKLHTIYNGVNLERFNPQRVERGALRGEFAIPDEAPVITMISVIDAGKGHYLLPQVAAKVIETYPDARFVVVGGSAIPRGYAQSWRGRLRRLLGQEYDPELKLHRLVEESGLVGRFIFTGFRTDTPQILADTDILLFPSIVPEGFGRPMVEAGAMEVPVIASRIGPHAEIILHGETGLLTAPNNPDEIAEGILNLLDQPDFARRLGKAARARVYANFSDEQYAAGIDQVLRQILQE